MSSNLEFWDSKRNLIRTRKGGWRIGKGVYTQQYSLLDDLVGKFSYFHIFILNITGKLPEDRLAKWLEAAHGCMSFPDSRIWCNQIGALGGTARATATAAITAGILASDSKMYGPGTLKNVCDFLLRAVALKENGHSLESITNEYSRRPGLMPQIPGYGRPLATGDERVEKMEKVANDLNFSRGSYQTFAYELHDYLMEHHKEGMNLATYIASFLLDQKLSSTAIIQLTSIIVAVGVAACYSEAYENLPWTFLPLRCDDIEYKGPAPRPVPDKDG